MAAANRELDAIEEQIAHVLEYMQELKLVALRMSRRPGRTFEEAEDLAIIRHCIEQSETVRKLYSQLWHTRHGNGAIPHD